MIDCLTPLQIAERFPNNNEEVVEMLRKVMSNPELFVDAKDSDSEATSNSSDDGSDVSGKDQDGPIEDFIDERGSQDWWIRHHKLSESGEWVSSIVGRRD
jgi:hypothetical protein